MSTTGRPPYPPERHLMRDLRFVTTVPPDEPSTTIPLVPELCGPSGHVTAGALATLVDIAGAGLALRSADPDWVATADLSLHRAAKFTGPDLVARPRIVRAGTGLIVVECDLYDAPVPTSPAPKAIGLMTFSRIPGRASRLTRDSAGAPVRQSLILPDSGFRAPFAEACGIVDIGPGLVGLEVAPYVGNSFGAINGGVVATLLSAAAESAARGDLGAAHVVTSDLEVRYLAQCRQGTVTATATLLGHSGPGRTCRVELTDDATGQLLALAVARADEV